MTIKRQVSIYFLLFLSVVIFSGIYLFWSGKKIDLYLEEKLPNSIGEIEKVSRLNIIAQLIRYDDEARTNSISNFVFTGDKKWKDRYDEFISKLNLRMNEVVNSDISNEERDVLLEIDSVNSGIVAMESEAARLVAGDDLSSAQKLLMGEEYGKEKELYKKGIEKLISLENINLDSTDSRVVANFIKNESDFHNVIHRYIYLVFILMILYLIILGLIFNLIIRKFLIPMNKFKKAAKEIASGNFGARADIRSKDEMGDLKRDLDLMVDRLQDALNNVDKKIKKRTENINKLNKFMVGRELKMIELKKQIKNKEK